MPDKIAESALDQLFRDARTYNTWTDDPVGEDALRAIWDLTKICILWHPRREIINGKAGSNAQNEIRFVCKMTGSFGDRSTRNSKR